MKVLNLSYDDYANYSYANMMALRSIEVECEAMKIVPHLFCYLDECTVATYDQMKAAIAKADVIQFIHTNCTFFKNFEGLLKDKKVAVYHTGTIYRRQPESINGFYNPVVDISFTDQCEFIGLGAKNLHYLAVAIDMKSYLKFNHAPHEPYIIGHYPSNAEVKGTEDILDMLKLVDKKYYLSHSTAKVDHDEQLKRVSDCDIYIELFKPELEGKPYGCYGVAAFEAAAMGKVVVTQNIRKDVYLSTYGTLPFQIANTKDEFNKTITGLLSLEPLKLNEMQTEAYRLINQNHSYKASGRLLAKILSML